MKRLGALLTVLILTACAAPAADVMEPTVQSSEKPAKEEQAIERMPADPPPTEKPPTEIPASVEPQHLRGTLPDLGPAPELENEIWLNTSAPLRLADLRGQVVILDMWTFG